MHKTKIDIIAVHKTVELFRFENGIIVIISNPRKQKMVPGSASKYRFFTEGSNIGIMFKIFPCEKHIKCRTNPMIKIINPKYSIILPILVNPFDAPYKDIVNRRSIVAQTGVLNKISSLMISAENLMINVSNTKKYII
jgi:hypothetical protein